MFLPFWLRLVLTIAVMLATSWVAGLIWSQFFSFPLPSYAAGVIGGSRHPIGQWNCWASVDPTRASVALSGLSAVDTRSK